MLLPSEPETYRDELCLIRVWFPARGLQVAFAEGTLTDRGATFLEASMTRALAEGSYASFNDWEGLVDYELSARLRLTRATARMIPHLQGAHILVRSRLVLLGIKMSSIVLQGKLTAHRERPPFERALAEALDARATGDLVTALR